ncbi:ATP-dependent sacrificial sulfur transferase LarE [Catellatospora sp. NPDC049609]|uniref:ATP-dependent sacrificial sulfur transferase LarE n=1 Tax=Catellatospora sp. NPDC049609 TaxID=3155505 RepID=UPI00341342B1
MNGDRSTAELADLLVQEIAGYGRTLVAASGGIDSTVVAAAAVRALGPAGVGLLTAVSASLPAEELVEIRRLAAELGVAHHTPATRELDVPEYAANGMQRCYFCKRTLLEAALETAAAEGYAAIATGTNATDLGDRFRPGIVAARERGARTPLADLGVGKEQVRAIARHWGLRTWDKPAAACLSSRIAYGISITSARLARVERAEAVLRRHLHGLGNRDLRVRDLGESVRVEVDADAVCWIERDVEVRNLLRESGFGQLSVEVVAFRSGSMNELPVAA